MKESINPNDPDHFSGWSLVLLIGLVALFLVSRLVVLQKMPIFIDETVHIGWARDIQQGQIAAGFSDGKWLSMILISLSLYLPGNALWLARFTAVMGGVATLAAIYLTGRELFSIKTTLLAILFYLMLPLALFYNRLALTDSIVAAFGAWVLYISVKTVRSARSGFSVVLAVLLISAMLAKLPGIIYIFIPPLAVLLLLPKNRWKFGVQRILPAILAGLATFSAVFLVQTAHQQVSEKTQGGNIGSVGQFAIDKLPIPYAERVVVTKIGSVGQVAIDNIMLLADWLWTLLTPPITILTGLLLVWLLLKRPGRPVWYLMSVLFTTLAPYILFARIWYPRYLSFALVPLVLLLAQFWSWIMAQISNHVSNPQKARIIAGGGLALLLIWPAIFNLNLLSRPDSISLPKIMAWQFQSGWPAGFGALEMANFLEAEAARTSPTPYLVRPYFWSHTNQGGLDFHLGEDNQLELVELGANPPAELVELDAQLLAGRRVLLAIDTTHPESVELFDAIASRLEATMIWHYTKPGASAGLEVWEVTQIYPAEGSAERRLEGPALPIDVTS